MAELVGGLGKAVYKQDRASTFSWPVRGRRVLDVCHFE